MPPKKYRRDTVSYVSLIRRPARKSKPPGPQETLNPVAQSTPSPVIPENNETPSQSPPNLTPCEEVTPTVVEIPEIPINQSQIDDSNVRDFSESNQAEKEHGNDGGDEKSAAESKNVVKKKKTKIVKRVVKRKVLRKIIREKVGVVNQDSGNDGMVSSNVVGDDKIVGDEGVGVEVDKTNLKTVESEDVGIGDRNNNLKTNCEANDVGNAVDGFVGKPTFVVWSEAENCSVVSEKQKELEVFQVVKHRVDGKNVKSSDGPNTDAVIMRNVSGRSCVEGRVNCSSVEDLSKVPGLDVDAANEKTGFVTGTQLEDCVDDCFQDQNRDNMVENNLDSESGGLKQEEGVGNNHEFENEDDKQEEGGNIKEERSDFSEMRADTSIGGTLLSGEMGALERRRRRKTEIFVGGLDKDTKEEEIRKIFEVLGEIKDVTLVNSSKTKNAFAFVRYALAADAKKALIKHRKVEVALQYLILY